MVKRLKPGKISKIASLRIQEGSGFRKDVKRMKQRGKSLTELKNVITLLANGQKLPGNYKDHSLEREWSEYRECHLREDFLLICKIEDDTLILERVGTHSELFE